MTHNIVKKGKLEEEKFKKYRKKPVVVEAKHDLIVSDKVPLPNASYLRDFFISNNVPTYVEANVKETMCAQVNHPVLWERIILSMAEQGVTTFIETGVGNTLQKLVEKIVVED